MSFLRYLFSNFSVRLGLESVRLGLFRLVLVYLGLVRVTVGLVLVRSQLGLESWLGS